MSAHSCTDLPVCAVTGLALREVARPQDLAAGAAGLRAASAVLPGGSQRRRAQEGSGGHRPFHDPRGVQHLRQSCRQTEGKDQR